MITVQVLYANGTPVVGAKVAIQWSYYGQAVVSFFGASGPTSANGTTNSNGYTYLGASIAANTTVDGQVSSSGGDQAEFTLVTDSNGNGTYICTTTWQPLAALSNVASTAVAKVGSAITTLVVLGVVALIAYVVFKKVAKSDPLSIMKSGLGRLSGLIGY